MCIIYVDDQAIHSFLQVNQLTDLKFVFLCVCQPDVTFVGNYYVNSFNKDEFPGQIKR